MYNPEGWLTLLEILLAMLLKSKVNKFLFGIGVVFIVLVTFVPTNGETRLQSIEENISGLPESTQRIVYKFLHNDSKINEDLKVVAAESGLK